MRKTLSPLISRTSAISLRMRASDRLSTGRFYGERPSSPLAGAARRRDRQSGRLDRHAQGDTGAPVGTADEPHLAAVLLDDLARDRHPEAQPARLAVGEERLEQARLKLLGDADARVGNDQLDPRALAPGPERQGAAGRHRV